MAKDIRSYLHTSTFYAYQQIRKQEVKGHECVWETTEVCASTLRSWANTDRANRASTYDFSARDSLSSFSTASDRGSMIRDLDRDSMEKAGRNTMLKIPEHVYIPKA